MNTTLFIIYELSYWLEFAVYTLYIITILSTILVIISENRNPVKSIAWIVVLVFLPFVGIIFYFFLGQDYTKHRLISKKGRRKLLRMAAVELTDIEVLPLSTESRQQIKLAYSLGKHPLHRCNEVVVFTTGLAKFDALKRELLGAKKFIHLQYYIFDDDKLGNEIKEILLKKVQEGVIVRILYDDVGCWSVKKKFFREMRAAGIEAAPFLEVRFRRLGSKINYRNHRKVVVIDGVVGFLGGMNIADRYVDGVGWGTWRDTHMMIRGHAVHGLQSSFAVDWYFTDKQLLLGDFYYPVIEPTRSDVDMQIVTSGPMGEWSEILMSLLKIITNAKKIIYIQTPYFLPTESLLKALQVAALAKVDVRLMLPSRSDSFVLQQASNSYLTPMLKSGVKVYFYEKGFLHAKTLVVDDEFSTIGSTNLDFRSFEQNFEINAFMYSRTLNEDMKRIFMQDQQSCRRITLSQWRHRPMGKKVSESFMRLMSPIL